MRPLAMIAATVSIALLVAGCDGEDDPPKTAPPAPPPARVDVDAAENVRAGPLVLYHARQFARAPRSDFDPVRLRGRLRREASPPLRRRVRAGSVYYGVKLLALIDGNRPVTLAVAPAARRDASLLYGRARRSYSAAKQELGLAEVADGRAVVRLEPHGSGPGQISEIPGGLVVAGARCLPLEVRVQGRKRPIRRTIAFGRGVRC